MKLIQAKAKGRKPKTPTLKVVHRQGKDLLSQLKASLQPTGGTRKRRAS
jgi:DNA end-binding protein Ku